MLQIRIHPPFKKIRKSIQEHKLIAPSCVRIYGCNYSDMRYSWEQLRLNRNCYTAETVPGLRIHSSKALSSQSKFIKSLIPTHSPCVPPLYSQHPSFGYSDWVISASTSQTGVVLRLGSLL